MTSLRLIRGGVADDRCGSTHRGVRGTAVPRTTRGPVHLRDFVRASDEMTSWQPRAGEHVVLTLYRFGPGAGDEQPSTATLHAIAGQVSRTLRRADVADAYSPSTIGVLLGGVRDVSAAMETSLQIRGMIDEHPLLPVESCIVVGQGMALALPGSDASVLMAEAEAALDESTWSATDVLCTRLVPRDTTGVPRTTALVTCLVRLSGAAPDPVWIALGGTGEGSGPR